MWGRPRLPGRVGSRRHPWGRLGDERLEQGRGPAVGKKGDTGRASWEGKWVLSVGKQESHFRLLGEAAIVLEKGVVRVSPQRGSEAAEDPG